MKLTKVMLWTPLSLALLLAGCKSGNETAGDKYLKGGDPINALVRYEMARDKGSVSQTFFKNYAKANIMLLEYRAKEDPGSPSVDIIKDTIASVLAAHPDPETEALFASALQTAATARLNAGSEEGGFAMLQALEKLPGNSGGGKTDGLRKQFLAGKLKEIESDYEDASSEPTSGILADYKMNKVALLFDGKEIPEIRGLWSKIRKLNLNTYLMYDYEGLITEPLDSRINKYGVLLAIVKLDKGATSLKVQAKAFNGGSGPITVLARPVHLGGSREQRVQARREAGRLHQEGRDQLQRREQDRRPHLQLSRPAPSPGISSSRPPPAPAASTSPELVFETGRLKPADRNAKAGDDPGLFHFRSRPSAGEDERVPLAADSADSVAGIGRIPGPAGGHGIEIDSVRERLAPVVAAVPVLRPGAPVGSPSRPGRADHGCAPRISHAPSCPLPPR